MSDRAPEARGTQGGSGQSQEATWPTGQLTAANKIWAHQRERSEPLGSSSPLREMDEEMTRGRQRTPVITDQARSSLSSRSSRGGSTQPPRSSPASSNLPIHIQEPPVIHPSENGSVTREVGPASNPDAVPAFCTLPDDPNPSPRYNREALEIGSSAEAVLASNSDPPTLSRRTPKMDSNPNSAGLKRDQTHPAFTAEWSYIQKCRNDKMGLQSHIHEMRRSLREKQTAKAVTEDRFIQRVRKKEMGVLPQEGGSEKEEESMLELMQKYQQARDEYGPLEDDCNRLEDQLYANEFELDRLEADFYSRWTVIPNPNVDQPNVPEFEEPQPASEDFDDEDEDLNYHPLVAKYLSKLGDLDLLQERLDEILDERDDLEDQRDTRKLVGLPLGTEEQAWLDGSQRLQAEAEEQLRMLEIEVEELKQECLTKNLIDEDGEPTDIRAQEQEIFEKEDELVSGSQISEYSKYPILLPQRGVKQEETSEYDPNPGEKSFTVAGRINTWLLDRLRSSPLDVGLLARTYEGKGGDPSDCWQISVLRLWYEDGTITGATGFQVYTSSMTTRARLRSESSTNPSGIFGAKITNHHYHLFIRSSLRQHSDGSDSTEVAGAILSSPASPRGNFSWNSQ